MRYAVYMTPQPGSPLADFGASVLADAGHGDALVPPAYTASPRVYGFHATLKAPFRLAQGCCEADLRQELAQIAASRPPLPIGRLRVATIGRFMALVPEDPPPGLGLLAAECVTALDHFRAPLNEQELARRRPEALSPRQRLLLGRWGYPYVLEQFRFHMTLADGVPVEERAALAARLEGAYAPLAGEGVIIDALTLLAQPSPQERFIVLARLPMTG